jgi:hypothetical protein
MRQVTGFSFAFGEKPGKARFQSLIAGRRMQVRSVKAE